MSIEEQMMKIKASSYPTRFLSRKEIPDAASARKVPGPVHKIYYNPYYTIYSGPDRYPYLSSTILSGSNFRHL